MRRRRRCAFESGGASDLSRLLRLLVLGAWWATDLSRRARDPRAASLAVHNAERVHPDGARGTWEVGSQRGALRLPGVAERGAGATPGFPHGGGRWRMTQVHRVVTPGTRVAFSDVGSWIEGYLRLHRRGPSSQRASQLRAHAAALTRELIDRELDEVALENLRCLFEDVKMGLKPPRGARHGSPYEIAVTGAHDRLAALRRPARRASERRETQRAVIAADAHILI